MGSGGSVVQDVESDTNAVHRNATCILKPKPIDVSPNIVVTSRAITISQGNAITFHIQGAGVLRIGILKNDPTGKVDCTKEAVYEIEIGLGPGESTRELYVDKGGYLCFGEKEKPKAYKYVRETTYYVYVLCIFGKPSLTALQGGNALNWKEVTLGAQGIAVRSNDSEVQFGIQRYKSTVVWKTPLKSKDVYNLMWKMELERIEVSDKVPKFGFIRMAIVMNQPSASEFTLEGLGNDPTTMWFTESAISCYPYSNVLAFKFDKTTQKISHNISVESVATVKSEDFLCEGDLILVVELYSGQIELKGGANLPLKQSLGSAYLVTNFDSSSYDTHDSVYNLIAAQVKHKPCRLQYGSRDDEFVVEFGENVPPSALDSLKATVKPIEPTKEVQFIGESGDTIDEYEIRNELHSDDDLGEVSVRTVGEHIWIVTFKTEEAARCVWTENERVIVNTKVTVLPYYQAIGVSHTKGRKPFRIIESRSIENLDEEKLKFVTGNQDEKQNLTHYLEQKFRGELLWKLKDDDSISFDYNGFDQTWFEQLSVDLKRYFDELKITTTSKDDNCKTDRSSEKVFEKNVFGKVMYLHGKGSIKDLLKRFPNSRLSIDQQKGIGKLIGPQVEIDGLFTEIQRLMLNLDEKEIQLSAPLADILKTPDCKDLLLKDMKDITNEDIKIIGDTLRIWEFTGGRIREIGTRKAEMIQRRINEVFVDREKLDVTKEFYPTFQTENWESFKDTLTEKYQNVCIEVKNQHGEINMHLTTTKQLFEIIKQEIGEFLAQHSKGEIVVQLGRDAVLLLKEYKPDISENVELVFIRDVYNIETGQVIVRGRVDERKTAVNDLLKARKRIQTNWFMVKKPWLASAVHKLKDLLLSIELGHKCIMQLEIADGLAEEMIPCVGIFPNTGCSVFVLQSEITAANYDVIVNITNSELQCSHGFSKILCNAAGHRVIQECKDYIKKRKQLSVGEVFTSRAGKLQCRRIVHVASPKWTDGTKGELNSLEEAVTNVLQATDEMKYTSLILPAIGCGDNGIPIDKGTKSIVTAMYKYMMKNHKSNIREIYFCDVDEKKIDAFTNAVTNVMKDQFVFKHGRDLPQKKGALATTRFGKAADKTRISKAIKGGEDLRFRPIPVHPEEELNEDSFDQRRSRTDDAFSSGLPYKIELSDSLKLHIEVGSIESQKVDVIVNTTAHFPEMGSALSRALLKSGGKDLQDECRRKGTSDFKDGKVVRTGVGNGDLRCKHLYHIQIDAYWDRQNGQERVYKTVQKCLYEANKHNCKSISFPTIGTGSSNFPPDKVADNMVRAVCDFAKGTENLSIEDIHVVIYFADVSTKQVFENEIPMHFKESGSNFAVGQVVGKGRRAGRKLRYVKKGSQTAADDVVLVKVIASSSISDIRRDFMKEIDELYDVRLVSYKELQSLTEGEESLIKGLSNDHHNSPVSLEIDKKKTEVKISGLKENADRVEENLREMLTLTIPEMRIQHTMGEHIAETVEWHYDNNGIKVPVAAPDNYVIQIHYMKGQDFEYKNTLDGKMYRVNLNKLEEHPVDNPKAVRRLYQQVKRSGDVTLPSAWDIAQDDSVKTKIVSLDMNGSEFLDVKRALLSAKCPATQIVDIKRIEDRYKWIQYMTKKQQMEKENPKNVTNERKLWHGTDVDTVDKIIKGGFDRNFRGRNATYYGDGVYFAVTSKYSHRYAQPDPNGKRYMFYNRVLTGEYCQGTEGMGVLPVNKTKNGFNILYDSAVDDMNSPAMYVIFHDTQAYPEYLIEYK